MEIVKQVECYRKNFISTNNYSSKSRRENDRRYLTEFLVNTSQSETDQSPDDEE